MTKSNREQLIAAWKAEEACAYIHGWDFSHIAGRYEEPEELPWDYRAVIDRYRLPERKLLDIDTGGGEFLLSLQHPYENTAATKNFPPNVQLCKETLLPLGIDFRAGDGGGELPFPDGSFHILRQLRIGLDAQPGHRIPDDGYIQLSHGTPSFVKR